MSLDENGQSKTKRIIFLFSPKAPFSASL